MPETINKEGHLVHPREPLPPPSEVENIEVPTGVVPVFWTLSLVFSSDQTTGPDRIARSRSRSRQRRDKPDCVLDPPGIIPDDVAVLAAEPDIDPSAESDWVV